MNYIIASAGRAGSSLVNKMLCEATGERSLFADTYEKLRDPGQVLKKTHLHYKEGLLDNTFRVVYLYRDNMAVIASLYSIAGTPDLNPEYIFRVSEQLPPPSLTKVWEQWMWLHLIDLQVRISHIQVFFRLIRYSKFAAFAYLTLGDKFRFRENMESWKKFDKTLFVRYEDLCAEPARQVKKIFDHLGLAAGTTIPVHPSRPKKLPFLLRLLIRRIYS